MRSLVIILLMVLASSCATQQRCFRKFPPEVSIDTIFKEIIKDTIIYKDTTIYISLPGETVIDSIFISQGIVTTPVKVLETDLARAEAYYRTPKVYLKLIQKDTTLRIRLDSALRTSKHFEAKYYEILKKQVQKEKYIPKLYSAAFWILIGIIGAIISYITLKLVGKL